MPTYEYECEKCGHQFERFQSMTDEPLKKCPKCRSKVRRVFGTGAGLIFHGSGFYQTDYRSEGYKSAAKKEVDPGAVKAAKGDKSEPDKKSEPNKKSEAKQTSSSE
jgi:putative FmdB family regulatory protein